MPPISVIIPTYNAEATIVETIESVRCQTFSNLEIIVVDDGSTDGTLTKVRDIKDERLRILPCTHEGLSASRNRGIQHAQGEFLSFIDADDLWTPDKLEMQLKSLQSQPQAGLAYSWTAFIDQQGRFLFAKEPLYFEGDVYAPLIRSCFIASGSNVLIRKSCVDSVGWFDTTLHAAEDWEYWLRVAVRWQFVVVPRYQVLYRFSSGAISSDVEAIETASLIVLDRALRMPPPGIQTSRHECLASLKQYVSFLYLVRASDSRGRAKAGQKLMEAIRLYPRTLLSRKTQRLFWSWLLLQMTSSSSAPRIMKHLLRLHGRWMMLVTPELRIRAIIDRK